MLINGLSLNGLGNAGLTAASASQQASLFQTFLSNQAVPQVIDGGYAEPVAEWLNSEAAHREILQSSEIDARQVPAELLRAIAGSSTYSEQVVADAETFDHVLGTLSQHGRVKIPDQISTLLTDPPTVDPAEAREALQQLTEIPEAHYDEEHLSLKQDEHAALQRQWLLQSSLVDGEHWGLTGQTHQLGAGATTLAQPQTDDPLQAVAMASFDASAIISKELLQNQQAALNILQQIFTERELDADNLGAYWEAGDKTKMHSRVAGMLSLKAATFRAAGLPLPGEAGSAGLSWKDVEYARQAYSAGGETRYHRVRSLHGRVKEALEGRGLFANFADEGQTGFAVVVVERSPKTSGIVSLGLDITDVARFGDDASAVQQAQSHAEGEAAYKATYFGGHQTYYLGNIMDQVHRGAKVGEGRHEYRFSGRTETSMRTLGGEQIVGSLIKQGRFVASLMAVRGTPKLRLTGNVPAQPATKPALAEMMANGEVNVIYALPGQASEFASWLAGRWGSSSVAKQIIMAQAPRLRERYGIDLMKLMKGEVPADVVMSSAYSQPLIGLTQVVANAELREMGYDLTKAIIIGHSQGIVLGLNAIGAAPDEDVVDFLGINGRNMQNADPWFDPEIGDDLTLSEIAGAGSAEQLELIEAFTGKISMMSFLGISRSDLEKICADVMGEMNEGLSEGQIGEVAQVSLINIEPSANFADKHPEGFEGHDSEKGTSLIVSGTTDAIKEVVRRVLAEDSDNRKVRALPTSAAFHSELMREGLKHAWRHLEGKSFSDIPTPVLMNKDGQDLREISGTVERVGYDAAGNEQSYTIDAQIAAVMEGQYVEKVDWPAVVWSAYERLDPNKPTVVIDGGPGTAIGTMVRKIITDVRGNTPVTVVSFGDGAGEALLKSGDLKEMRGHLVNPEIVTDPAYRPLLQQVEGEGPVRGRPEIDGEYTGPHAYLAQVNLADPDKRRELIQRLERALNIDENGEPHFHSEFLESLGYDASMPLVLAAMTGNTRADLVSALAAERMLGIFACTTVGFNFKALAEELDKIHAQTQAHLKEKGDENWEQGAPFGVNIIHGTGSYKRQIQEILSAIERGVPINFISVAFSDISLSDWDEYYMPLLRAGVTVMPLGENEGRWDLFRDEIYPEVPKELQHLLAIAPEGAEGGGHNIKNDRENIRFGHNLTRSLMKQPFSKPWFMTGGQSTPQALADALLVMALESVRGGMQIGGAMQVALESTPPEQVKRFIAEAMAGDHRFVQVLSEFERNINLIENDFSRRLVEIGDIMADVPSRKGDVEVRDLSQISPEVNTERRQRIKAMMTSRDTDAMRELVAEYEADPTTTMNDDIYDTIGEERARKIVELMMQEAPEQRQILLNLWYQEMNDFNFMDFTPYILENWQSWLDGDVDALTAQMANFTPPDVIRLYRSYRTWALMESGIDPNSAYVLGGRSIRAMGRALEAEGQDAQKYLLWSAPDIFRDLMERTKAYMLELYQRAMAIEEAERDNYELRSISDVSEIAGVQILESEDLQDGQTSTVRVRLRKDLDQAAWTEAVQSLGYGAVARVLRTDDVGHGVKEGNPMLRALQAERGDQVEILRRQEGNRVILEGLRIYNHAGDLVVDIMPTETYQAIEETWYLPQTDGTNSPVTWRYEIQESVVGSKRVILVEGNTAEQGREAYTQLWVGPNAKPNENLADPATATYSVTEADVRSWHRQINAKSRQYTRRGRDGQLAVHPTFPLRAAWASMMQAGMHPDADIDYLKVVHSAQTMRMGVPVRIGDELTATSQVSRIENHSYGREATIVSTVVNQDGELVAEYQTKFLSRKDYDTAEVAYEADVAMPLAPTVPRLEVDAVEVYKRTDIVLTRDTITGYEIDAQWLHTNDRFARRVGFKNGIIAQGWRLLHAVSHSVVEGYLGNDASRFVGFGKGTAVTAPVSPDEKLTLEVDRVGLQGDREVLEFRLISAEDDQVKASGTLELRLPPYGATFPGNASQAIGMAKDLYEAGGIGREVLEEAVHAFSEDEANLLLDVITDGASIPEGDEARQQAYDAVITVEDGKKKCAWLNDVINSSPAVLATSMAWYRSQLANGFPPASLVSGHSLGQYTAAVAAGVLSLQEAMRLVRRRGELMKKHAQGTIAAIGSDDKIDLEALQRRLNELAPEGQILEIANINKHSDNNSQIVISGDKEAITVAVPILKTEGYKGKILNGNIAFHSSKVQAMETEFRAVISGMKLQDPQVPMASIVEPGQRITTREQVIEELVNLNHSQVRWSENAVSMSADTAGLVEFANKATVTSFNMDAVSDGRNSAISTLKMNKADTAFLDRPKPRRVAKPKAPAAPAQAEAAPATAAPIAGAAPQLEAEPAPYSPVQMQILDLYLTSARVVGDANGIESVELSPLVPSLDASASEFVWHAIVQSLVESKSNVAPADVTPETTLASTGLDSLGVAKLYGLIRHRVGIETMPTDDEVKALETGTLEDAFSLVAAYWSKQYGSAGGTLDVSQVGSVSAPAGKSFKDMLADAGLGGTKSLFSRVEGRKIGVDTPGWEAVADAVFANANEGAAAGLEGLQARVAGWKYHKDYAKSGEALAAVKGAFYQNNEGRFDEMRQAREARNAQARMAQPMMGGAVGAPAQLEEAPAPFTPVQMQVLDLYLTSARVVGDANGIESVALSPIVPSLDASPSEFVWHAVVQSLVESKSNVAPGDVTPETTLASTGLDSLGVAKLYGLIRHRVGIETMPTDDEVKALETGTLEDAFNLVAAYWSKQYGSAGGTLDVSQVGSVSAPAGKSF